MPAPKHKSIKVNLVPKDPFSQSPLGRFLNWALSVGRYIVVFTEMVVILTFLSRFTLDRQLTDLNDSILKKQAFLNSYTELESKVRVIQKKAQFVQKIQNNPQIETIDFLTQNLPPDIIFEEISTKSDRFVLTARAFSQSSLSSFITQIKQNPSFHDVRLDKINTSEKDSGIAFVVRASFTNQSTPKNEPAN